MKLWPEPSSTVVSARRVVRPGTVKPLIARPLARSSCDTSGRTRGTHEGVAFYTVGQRRRINVGSPIPLYVVALDPQTNTVVVGSDDDLRADALSASDCNWIAVPDVAAPLQVQAKIRYNMHATPARVEPVAGGEVHVVFETPQRAVTPGQSAVLYDGDVCLGGGIIA